MRTSPVCHSGFIQSTHEGITSQIARACFIFARNDNLSLFASPLEGEDAR